MRYVIAFVMLCALAGSANAHSRHHRHHYQHRHEITAPDFAVGLGYGLVHQLKSIGPRPRAWCGWEMRREMGVSDPAYNLARNWSHYGSPAHGPGVGVIVVWPHHVGRIVGGESGHWLVHSGNDGHQIRERVRSVAGAIAFRWPA